MFAYQIRVKGVRTLPEKPLPNYEVVSLRIESIGVGVVESRLRTIDADNPEKGKMENLNHLLWLVDKAQAFGRWPEVSPLHTCWSG